MNAAIEMMGNGLSQSVVFDLNQLRSMPMVGLRDVLMRKTHSEDKRLSCEGPSLESLLGEAQLKPGSMKVRLIAADGFTIETTLDELDDAVVALKDGEGRWLGETDAKCPLKLVPPRLPGNFWVMNLCRIQVEPVSADAS